VAPVDVVVANILSSAVLALLPAIASALPNGGRAILSGILREERQEILNALTSGSWHLDREDAEDIWWSVAVTRP
jgi:ribosomal protein L11 methyltransferase